MSKQVQKRRGTSSEHANFTGAVAEITVDTETNELVLGDGVTQGGRRVGISRVTTSDLINSVVKYPESDVIETSGFTTAGDGGSGKWKQNGVTGQTPSQTPAQLGDALLNDASGKQWQLVGDTVTSNQVGVFGSSDSAGLISYFLTIGGNLHFDKGDYVIAESGPSSGKALAFISKSITVTCSEGANFIAGNNLDDDMIRIKCDPTGYTSDRIIEIKWYGGKFDQTLQKNSTSVPNSADYPPQNLGTTGTANCLAIDGEINNGGPTQGFNLFRARGIYAKASDTGHWQSAGGDTGIGCNALVIDIEECEFIGQRDAGTYPSGLSAGTVEDASGNISNNIFRGCWAGATAKRNFNQLTMKDNKGFNSGTVVSCSMVTGGTISGEISGNIGYNAWRVVNANGARDVNIHNNHSHRHGHLLENDVVPTSVFNSTNACVYSAGSQDCNMSFNSIYTREPLYTTLQSYTVWLTSNGSEDSDYNVVEFNSGFETYSLVNELAGNNNTFKFNFGRSLNIRPVVLTGVDSVDLDKKQIYTDISTVVISSGVINANSSYILLDTEGGSAADDLVTINGGSDGQRLLLQARLSSRDVTLKDGDGNMELAGDFTLSNVSDTIELVYRSDNSFWYEVSRSDNKS